MKLDKYFRDDYIAIGIGVLESGMKINYNVYGNHNGSFILLCKDAVLTDELIAKFKKVTYPNYKVYIPKEQYGKVVMEGIRLRGVQDGEVVFAEYEEVKKDTAKMLNEILKEDVVPPELANSISETVRVQVETVDLALIIESINGMRSVDEDLHTHSVNVALLNGLIGKWMECDEEDLYILVKIGILHDIGKLKVPNEVLHKAGKLTNEEFNAIKKHPIYAYEILTKSEDVDERILQGVVQHHEKVNGSGYPYGLNMEQITEFARITSVSDVYDAMVAKRAYKKAHPPFQILSELAEGRFSELDLKYVNIFLSCMMEELKGKNVIMSNGKSAKVVFVDSSKIAFPIVQMEEEILYTNSDLYPVSLQIFE